MRFLQPNPITDASLISSNVPETEYATYAAGTTYALAARCIKSHKIWESAKAANVGHDPDLDDGTNWFSIGPTNRWAMFDKSVGSVTTHTNPIIVVLSPVEPVNALGLLDLVAESVRVSVVSGSVTVYDKTFSMADRRFNSGLWDFFFEPLDRAAELIIEDLPPAGQITITINGTACGTLALGRMYVIGSTREKPDISIIDYSKKSTDDFGVTSIVERGYSKRFEVDVIVEANRTDAVARKLAEIRSIAVIWIGDDTQKFSSLIAYGYYRDWGINITYPFANICEGRLSIEGLT